MNGKRIWAGGLGLLLALLVIGPGTAAAQQHLSADDRFEVGQNGYPRAYDGLQAGADAAAWGHAERLAAIRMQLCLIELMKFRSGLPPGPIARQPIGLRQIQTGPNLWESHPVYAGSRIIETPPFPDERPAIPAPVPNVSGPREF